MRSQIKLGRIFGIKIGLHYSWLLIAFLIGISLWKEYHTKYPLWPMVSVVGLAIATALLFFASLLMHELAHALMAKTYAIPVHEITLFALGGVSQLGGEAPSAKAEFSIAIVGPLTSALFGAFCLGVVHAMSGNITPGPFMAMLSWLGYINLGLGAFNMVPGYPMDGGRILRAAIWWKTGNMDRATRDATRVGRVVATLFIVAGLLNFFRGGGIEGLWITFIGWFLLEAARESYIESALRQSLAGIHVSDLMVKNYPTVDGRESIQDFVENTLLRTGGRSFLVTEGGNTIGLITPHEVRHIERSEWPRIAVDAVMRPLKSVRTISPDAPMMKALEVMGQENVAQLPVVFNGQVTGILPREIIFGFLQNVMELEGVTDVQHASLHTHS
ncbi:site-2 protease family protein [Acidipila rosea]|uniref:Zinc metalloprotease n=1 Tax=Acidipila rosea TaxID=768535 RepID=A0A4R1L6T7_9BACT|nr:site-2 protease family protein [Acidipila rosea]TCK72753.1 Zn-dependent protease [Acidipila rosea]